MQEKNGNTFLQGSCRKMESYFFALIKKYILNKQTDNI